jgi:DNA-binding XRE family transcriptional regulator
LAVDETTYLHWEKGQTIPAIEHYPGIFRFLGYDPFPTPVTLAEQIGRKRRVLGLSISDAARLVGVDEGTFARWERGEWKPRMSQAKVDQFLAMRPTGR